MIGVARGNMEHGPRALGHRSLLAVNIAPCIERDGWGLYWPWLQAKSPLCVIKVPSAGMKERMNSLKVCFPSTNLVCYMLRNCERLVLTSESLSRPGSGGGQLPQL